MAPYKGEEAPSVSYSPFTVVEWSLWMTPIISCRKHRNSEQRIWFQSLLCARPGQFFFEQVEVEECCGFDTLDVFNLQRFPS